MSFGGSFGGGGGDLSRRAEIILGMKLEGENVADHVRLEIERLAESFRGVETEVKSGNVTVQQGVALYKTLSTQIAALTSLYDDLTASANAAAQAEIKAAQETIKEINKQSEVAEKFIAKQIEDERKVAEGKEASANKQLEAAVKALLKQDEAEDRARQKKIDSEEAKAAAARAQATTSLDVSINAMMKELDVLEDTLIKESQAYADAAVRHEAITAKDSANYQAMLKRNSKALEDSFTQGMVPLEALQMSGIKLQDTLSGAGKKSHDFGLGILHVSHAFQDLQYGMAAVLNNIPLIVTSMGGGPGLAGVIMSSMVGVQLLRENFDSLLGSIGLAIPKTKEYSDEIVELTERIKELNKEPIKLAVDMRELEEAEKKLKKLKDDKAAFDASLEGKTAFEKEAGSEAKEIFEGSGKEGGALSLRMRGRMIEELVSQSEKIKAVDKARAEAQKELRDAEDMPTKSEEEYEARAARIKAAEGRLNKAVAQASAERENIRQNEAPRLIGELFKGTFAGNDPEARKHLAERMRQAGGESMALQMEMATPEAAAERAKAKIRFDNQQNMKKLDAALSDKAGRELEGIGAFRWDEAQRGERGREAKAKAFQERLDNLAKVDDAQTGEQAAVAKAEAAAAKKAASPAAVHAAELSRIAAGLESQFGATPDEARSLAPAVDRFMDKNASFEEAASLAWAQANQAMQNAEMTFVRQQAQMEQLGGMFGQFSMMLMNMQQQQAAFQGRMNGLGNRRRGSLLGAVAQ